MKIKLKLKLEIPEILREIKRLKRKIKLGPEEETKLRGLTNAYRVYEESGDSFYIDESTIEVNIRKFRKALTFNRLKLLDIIKNQNINSVTQLARITKRDIKNIYQDIKILEESRLISLIKETKEVKPILKIEEISFEF